MGASVFDARMTDPAGKRRARPRTLGVE